MSRLVDIVGESPAIRAVRDQVGRLLARQTSARRPVPVLLLGETGTGKGLLAQRIHAASQRGTGPFVAVNCAAIPETLVEAELFGAERGAFTDARHARPGMFQSAHRGTLFLDEIGALPLSLQPKLLTALEDRVVRRLGSTRGESLDVWIIAATSEDLVVAARERRFREDLYHRLSTFVVTLPPLRERGGDILSLADHFLAQACADYGLPEKRLSADARAALLVYPWPGNVRELANVMERAVLLADETSITATQLGLTGQRQQRPGSAVSAERRSTQAGATEEFERAQIMSALEGTDWNLSRAANHLGMPRNTVRYRMEKYGLRRPEATPSLSPPRGSFELPAPLSTDELRWQRRPIALLEVRLEAAGGAEPAPSIQAMLGTATEKARVFGGRILALEADGVTAAFGLEPAEDASSRAVYAGLAIRKALERTQRDESTAITARIAVHVAQCRVGRRDDVTVIEPGDEERARGALGDLIERSQAGPVVASSAATPLIERRFSLADTGRRDHLRGRIVHVTGPEPTGLGIGGRALSRFVGREGEMSTLLASFGRVELGEGQVIGLMGDAGVGKSRLLYELRRQLDQLGVRCVEGRCFAHAIEFPYAPIIDLVRHTCGVDQADAPDLVAEKVSQVLGDDPANQMDDSALLLRLLGIRLEKDRFAGLSPQAFQLRTFETLRRLWLAPHTPEPLFMAVEDLHWIDKSSEAFVAHLIERAAAARILLVVTYRPGYQAPWLGRSYSTQVAVMPLSPDASLDIIRSVLGIYEVPDAVARLIVPRTGGNPFFIEELAWSLKAQGDPAGRLAVPESVQEVLLARIDRLRDDLRRLLLTASVLGREISLSLLEMIWADPPPVDVLLRELVQLEFLTDRPEGGEHGYRFKHALTQEVAYASLTPERRRQLHAAAAERIERAYTERLDEVEAQLAHHYSEAEDADKAIEYLVRIAEKAARTSAYAESTAAVRRARSFAERLPSGLRRDQIVLDLVLHEAHFLHFPGLVQDALELLLSHRSLVERLDEPRRSGPYYFWLARTYSILGDREQMYANARRAIEISTKCDDAGTTGRGHFLLAFQEFGTGHTVEGIAHARQAVDLLKRAGDRWWLGMAHWAAALNLLVLGQFEEALAAVGQLREVGQALEDSRLLSYAAWTAGWVHASQGDHETGIEECERAFDLAQDPVSAAYASGHLGFALLQAGNVARAIPMLQEAVNQFGQFRPGSKLTQARFLAWLAAAHLLNGDDIAAERSAEQSLEYAEAVGHRLASGLAMRTLSEVYVARGELAEARRRLTQALAVLAGIQAGWERGRTQAALDRLEALASSKGHPRGDT